MGLFRSAARAVRRPAAIGGNAKWLKPAAGGAALAGLAKPKKRRAFMWWG